MEGKPSENQPVVLKASEFREVRNECSERRFPLWA